MSPLEHPTWGGRRENAGRKPTPKPSDSYSLSRAIAQTLQGNFSGYEAEVSAELHSINRKLPVISHLRGLGGLGQALSVPLDLGFSRDLGVGTGGGSSLFGRAVREELGLLQWSAVARAGATIITDLTENVNLVHVSELLEAEWIDEVGAISDSAPIIAGSVASPKRLACTVELTKQLSVQSNRAADALIEREIGRALSAMLDHTALFGTGVAPQPRGVLSTLGVLALPIGTDELWGHLARMRRRILESDAEPDTYAAVSSPTLEEILTGQHTAPAGGLPVINSLRYPFEVSNQVDGNRMFTGCWAYLCILSWGAGVDLVIDSTTQAHRGMIRISAALYADTVVRFPQAFAYTEEISPISPGPPLAGEPAVKAEAPSEPAPAAPNHKKK